MVSQFWSNKELGIWARLVAHFVLFVLMSLNATGAKSCQISNEVLAELNNEVDEIWKRWLPADFSDQDWSFNCAASAGSEFAEFVLGCDFDSEVVRKMFQTIEEGRDDIERYVVLCALRPWIYPGSGLYMHSPERAAEIQKLLLEYLVRSRGFRQTYHWFGIWTGASKFQGIWPKVISVEWATIETKRTQLRKAFQSEVDLSVDVNRVPVKSVERYFLYRDLIVLFHITGRDDLITALDFNIPGNVARSFEIWDGWMEKYKANLTYFKSEWRFKSMPGYAQIEYFVRKIGWIILLIIEGTEREQTLLLTPSGPSFIDGYPDNPLPRWKGPVLERTPDLMLMLG